MATTRLVPVIAKVHPALRELIRKDARRNKRTSSFVLRAVLEDAYDFDPDSVGNPKDNSEDSIILVSEP